MIQNYRSILEVLKQCSPKHLLTDLSFLNRTWASASSASELWLTFGEDFGFPYDDSTSPKTAFLHSIQRRKSTVATVSHDSIATLNIGESHHWDIRKLSRNLQSRDYSFSMLPNGSLFLCGGYDSNVYCVWTIKSCLIISMDGFVSPLPDMLDDRCFHGVVTYKSKVFVFGGFSGCWYDVGGCSVTKNEVFCDSGWTRLPDLASGRYQFSPCFYKDRIYLSGGWCASIEVFNPETCVFDPPLNVTIPERTCSVSVLYHDALVVITEKWVSKYIFKTQILEVREKPNQSLWGNTRPVLIGDQLYVVSLLYFEGCNIIEVETGKRLPTLKVGS